MNFRIRKLFCKNRDIIVVILLLNLVAIPTFSQKLIKTKIAKGVIVEIPEGLIPMSKEDITQQFPTQRDPLGAYISEDRLAYFSVNWAWSKWPDGDEMKAKGFLKAGILNLFDGVKMIDEGIKMVHKKKFVYFEFESRISGKKEGDVNLGTILKYTYIQYFISAKRTLVFTFSCQQNISSKWQEETKRMMSSVKIRQ